MLFYYICDNILERSRNRTFAPVAQLDRVFGYEPKGQGFESLPARQNKQYTFRCAACFFVRGVGLEPARGQSVKKTVRWTVFSFEWRAFLRAVSLRSRRSSLPARQNKQYIVRCAACFFGDTGDSNIVGQRQDSAVYFLFISFRQGKDPALPFRTKNVGRPMGAPTGTEFPQYHNIRL